MNRLLATTLEYLNFVLVLVIIVGSAAGGWFFIQQHPIYRDDPAMLAAGAVVGAIGGFLLGALIGGMIAFVALIEKHLREIRGDAAQQTALFRSIEELARADVAGTTPGPAPGDASFGERTRYRRDPGF